MAELLVSVRNEAEAAWALAGGADRIDVKEPSRGPLGRADQTVINEVRRLVAGRKPLSVALGELRDLKTPAELPPEEVLVKVGLSGMHRDQTWKRRLPELGLSRLVAVAYADHARAESPDPRLILSFAAERGARGFLIDTWTKDGTNLFHWLSGPKLALLARECRAAGILLALAGSLHLHSLPAALALGPDVVAVRGSACRQGQRDGPVDPEAVRALVRAIASPRPGCGVISPPGGETRDPPDPWPPGPANHAARAPAAI